MPRGRPKRNGSETDNTSNGNGSKTTSANLGYEARLWQMADALRNNMDAAEYKHVVLGLIFLKYISDAFEAKHAALEAERAQGADPEDPDEYRADNIFWVPPEARWAYLKAMAPQPTIGKLVDDAMEAIERDNASLKGVLPKDYARPGLDKQRLGQIINLVSDIALGSPTDRAKDTLGRVYEYFLARFASAEGKSGGQFYTPSHVVRVLVEMLAPYKGRVYDPCCGSGGMFVQSEAFIRAHTNGNGNGGKAHADISIWGQESNYTTWRLAKMNLAIRGIDAQIGHGDTFHNDRNPDLKADYVLANPPFNDSDWRGDLLKDDKRWVFGTPPAGNANFAWVQHFIYHLAPTGLAGFVLANGSMSSNQSGEGEIRKAIVEADLVDCMVALPGQLFYSTQIPVCLWFLARTKKNGRFRDRRGETLFIDARKMGTLVDRVHRELTDEDIQKIAGTYHAWRGDPAPDGAGAGTGGHQGRPYGCDGAVDAAVVGAGLVPAREKGDPVGAGLVPARNGSAEGDHEGRPYVDVPGFCKAATLDDIRKHAHVLTPGRYVGAAAAEEDDEPFEEKMARLAKTLREQQEEAQKLDAAIAANMKELGYGG
ncbi:MAG: SAM-dependent DNA methyltransferase [Rhodoplanes sp.]|uniref:type I restriction-modification system subunit M n=1 Tax=Rhodoplanes sp. TaxID=1968906 RepID=UPI001823F6EC|nr:class I SAM-dependent DNA methyltransferase [Rhodoplanes sp.]NVO14053.1 SAM-dependent DNA methyltransferase [Rhodoplanes sp.]